MKWLSEDREIVRRNQAASVPIKVTAKAVGRSPRAVRTFASDNGYLQPHWTKAQTQTALEMKVLGKTSREIGAVVGKSAGNVRRMFWRLRNAKV